MCNPTDRLGFHAWYEFVFGTGTITEDCRDRYELCRWAWKELQGMGKEPTCAALVWIILFTPADRIIRGIQILDQGYAPYEADLRRQAASLANPGRAGWRFFGCG